MNKLLIAAGIAAASVSAQAKLLLDVDAGAGAWFTGVSEESYLVDAELFNLTDDLGFSSGTNAYLWLSIDQPLPIIPDAKVRYQQLSVNAKIDAAQTLGVTDAEFAGVDLAQVVSQADVDVSLDLSHFDLIARFELPLPLVDLGFGANLKLFAGSFEAVSADGTTVNESGNINFPMPLPYAFANVGVPATGLELGGEVSGLMMGGNGIVDWQVGGRYLFSLPTDLLLRVGVEAGFKQFIMKFEEEEILGIDTKEYNADVTLSGAYVGVTAHF